MLALRLHDANQSILGRDSQKILFKTVLISQTRRLIKIYLWFLLLSSDFSNMFCLRFLRLYILISLKKYFCPLTEFFGMEKIRGLSRCGYQCHYMRWLWLPESISQYTDVLIKGLITINFLCYSLHKLSCQRSNTLTKQVYGEIFALCLFYVCANVFLCQVWRSETFWQFSVKEKKRTSLIFIVTCFSAHFIHDFFASLNLVMM